MEKDRDDNLESNDSNGSINSANKSKKLTRQGTRNKGGQDRRGLDMREKWRRDVEGGSEIGR